MPQTAERRREVRAEKKRKRMEEQSRVAAAIREKLEWRYNTPTSEELLNWGRAHPEFTEEMQKALDYDFLRRWQVRPVDVQPKPYVLIVANATEARTRAAPRARVCGTNTTDLGEVIRVNYNLDYWRPSPSGLRSARNTEPQNNSDLPRNLHTHSDSFRIEYLDDQDFSGESPSPLIATYDHERVRDLSLGEEDFNPRRAVEFFSGCCRLSQKLSKNFDEVIATDLPGVMRGTSFWRQRNDSYQCIEQDYLTLGLPLLRRMLGGRYAHFSPPCCTFSLAGQQPSYRCEWNRWMGSTEACLMRLSAQ